MSLTTFAGSAQFASASILGTGGTLAAAVIAAILLNARYGPIGVAVAPSLTGLGGPASSAPSSSWTRPGRCPPTAAEATTRSSSSAPVSSSTPHGSAGRAAGVLFGDLLGDPARGSGSTRRSPRCSSRSSSRTWIAAGAPGRRPRGGDRARADPDRAGRRADRRGRPRLSRGMEEVERRVVAGRARRGRDDRDQGGGPGAPRRQALPPRIGRIIGLLAPRCWRRSSPSARSETARSSSTSARSGWEPRPSRWPSRRPRSSWWWSRRSSPPSRERSSRAVGFDPDDALPRPRVVRRLASPGPMNAITDVAGVRVGMTTLIEGDGLLDVGTGPIRTGVTAIVPHEGIGEAPLFAGCHTLNGNGELTGLEWVRESEAPHHADRDHEHAQRRRRSRRALVAYEVRNRPKGPAFWSLPWSARPMTAPNDINGQHVRPSISSPRSSRPRTARSPRGASAVAPGRPATTSRAAPGPRPGSLREATEQMDRRGARAGQPRRPRTAHGRRRARR